ncbi:carbohydrate ABC transporter permease [Arthrobacter agilis]|uniref:carbohydrate ABC transporter permease n=1 Tax=Arthrobacter agilis TaxID=37921 RepID=UPI002781FA35|nr:sugar ABC transporter permease [Arthrobacter agilis]MDQ0735882.1 multiple sugar transport system permease protein [Arthrobacter agilis]
MTTTPARPLREDGPPTVRPAPSSGRPVPRGRAARRAIPLAPAVVLLLLFMLGPVLWSIWGSFTNASLSGRAASEPRFVGLDNYVALLSDPDFPNAVWLTVVFLIVSAVIGQNFLGLGLALLTATAPKIVRSIVATTVVTAWVLPEIVAAFACYAFFSSDGTLNTLTASVGLEPVEWLFAYPLASVILANIWRGTAFSMMIYEAALNDVAPEITEAAVIDGAGGWKRLIFVTIPMIRNSISTNLMLITLQTLSVFTLIFVMTSGGPNQRSSTLPLFAYAEAFGLGKIGYGTAIATVMLLIGAVFSFLYIRVLKPGDTA